MDLSFSDLLIPSPIQKIDYSVLSENNIQLDVKREDLIHPEVSGNKWRKLKFNLSYAKENNLKTIITFGGAFSNHIYAVAAACKHVGLNSIGIIRGEYDANNPTLKFARSCGMELKFFDRTSYRLKEQSAVFKQFLEDQELYHIVPEGGSNQLAYEGLKELTAEINKSKHDIVLVSAGTGGTAAGILKWLDPDKELWVFSSLKSDHLYDEIISRSGKKEHHQLKFISKYHCGGYGKTTENLISFINQFNSETNIPLDPIYNGKLIFGFVNMIQSKQIKNNTSYVWIHTGGLQGINAYNYMALKKNKPLIK